MKILYLSCHQILEYDEVKLLHELGHDVFSTGSYAYPFFRGGMLRPGIDTLPHYPEMERLASTFVSSGFSLDQALIDWADTIITMHMPEALEKNWPKMKGKRVIFRSIGQCIPHQERMLSSMVAEGLQIVRYSPKEKNIFDFAGENAMIRFYKDPNEYKGWTGEEPTVINFSQSLTQRARYLHKYEIMKLLEGFPNKIYGTDNQDLGAQWGGQITHEEMLSVLRKSRVFVYAGTWPAAYTLSFIEAMMTGVPIVATSVKTARVSGLEEYDYYEVPDIIQNGVNGFVSDDLSVLRREIDALTRDNEYAKMISHRGRDTAIEYFGKNKIKEEWRTFLL